MAGSVFKVALAALLLFQSWTAAYVKRERENQWVDIWGTMPQLVEPANLPPAPYASIPPCLPGTLCRSASIGDRS